MTLLLKNADTGHGFHILAVPKSQRNMAFNGFYSYLLLSLQDVAIGSHMPTVTVPSIPSPV